jgi:hypothetical protein
MMFEETVDVYYEIHTEHTDTVRTSQDTHCIFATKSNRLLLFSEMIAVYCQDHAEHVYIYI